MRHTIPSRLNAGAPSTIPRLLAGLLLCGALLLPAAAPANACGLDWASVAPLVEWTAGTAGPFTFPMTTFGGAPCPPGLTVTISISQGATPGAFSSGTNSHREDCVSGCTVNNFGPSRDLAVVFDPTAGGASPVTVTATFSSPFPNLKLEISDVDFSVGAPGEHRRDQVTITSNAGNPTLTPKTATPTFSIASNTATANCTVAAEPNCNPATDTTAAPSDNGTVVADFGALSVSTLTITYTEAGNGSNPSGRGIGVLANLTPVELMSFSVD